MNQIIEELAPRDRRGLSKEKLVEIANLEVDCKIGKDRHFVAADRKNRLRVVLGLFSVIGSAIMASEAGPSLANLIKHFFSSWAHIDDVVKFLSTLLPLLVGVTTAVIGFLGLEKQTAQHRFVGNAYIEISRKARSIINDANSSLDDCSDCLRRYEELLNKYLEINKEGEACPTNKKDSNIAMSMNAKRRTAIKLKLQEYDIKALGIREQKSKRKITFFGAIRRGILFRVASFLLCLRLLRKSDYRRMLRSI